jgi:predicted anti-sigma-YlaC factor YlaD
MTRCTEIRAILDQWVEGALDAATAAAVTTHIATCASCRDEAETLRLILDTARDTRELQPPASLGATIAASPCQRWQTMLFRAHDDLLPQDIFERVIEHVDACPDCRRVWSDLTLIRQAGDALTPPPQLAQRCVAVRRRRRQRPLGLRTAAAAALLLAAVSSFVLGNLMTSESGRQQAIHTAVGESVTQVADTDTSELRLVVWKAWHWAGRQLHALGELFTGDGAKTGDPGALPAPTPTPDSTNQSRQTPPSEASP